MQEKALEAKLRKQRERDAAKEARQQKEMAAMSEKMQKKNLREAKRREKHERGVSGHSIIVPGEARIKARTKVSATL